MGLHVVLVHPEIHFNTGSVGRSCLAVGATLHLIEPLGFSLDDARVKRAGLDYWPRLAPAMHESFDAYLQEQRPGRMWLFTTRTTRALTSDSCTIRPGDHLILGKDTRGLPDDLLARFPDSLVTLPMLPNERSLNLATAVCAAVYLGIDQGLRDGVITLDSQGRLAGRGVG